MHGRQLQIRTYIGPSVGLIAALIAGLCIGLRGPTSSLPVVAVQTTHEAPAALFAKPAEGERKRWLKASYRDVDGSTRSGKTSLRGFSRWHRGRTKPSLRFKAKGQRGRGPQYVELSRPEDPLALCNWLPDQLGAGLGLMHEHSSAVQLLLNGQERGVYLRSIRPGDDLCAAEARPRGTFFKGDCIGDQSHLDLWSGRSSWRQLGRDDARAVAALDELLASLSAPASTATMARLVKVFDVDVAARASAVAALVASNHADAVHNHVLFYDRAKQKLEPLLWDANGFGMHADPSLPVDVARHPIAERLLCDPEFRHRRNQTLWQLLQTTGSARALTGQAEGRLARLDAALRTDPAIQRLTLRRGKFEGVAIQHEDLAAELRQFETFVAQRAQHLHKWLDHASVSITAAPDHAGHSLVTVFGNVAVRLSRHDGEQPRSPTGRPASILWPGLSAALRNVVQRCDSQGNGVAAPAPTPVPLQYLVAAEPSNLVAHNAITGSLLQPEDPPPTAAWGSIRSLHPWQQPIASDTPVVIGPGTVCLDQALIVRCRAGIKVLPGTHLVVSAPITCEGPFEAVGSEREPIEIESRGHGISVLGSRVQLQHVRIACRPGAASTATHEQAMLRLGNCKSELAAIEFEFDRAAVAVHVLGGSATIRNTVLARRGFIGLHAEAASVRLEDVSSYETNHAVVARDGAKVHWLHGELSGHMIGVRAERSNRSFDGATITLEHVRCRNAGKFDVDCDEASIVQLLQTNAQPNPIAMGKVLELPAASTPAAPR